MAIYTTVCANVSTLTYCSYIIESLIKTCIYTVIRFSVSITPSGTNTAGETYSLVCSVTVTGSTDTPTIVWLDPINSQVPSEMVSTTGGISTLTFNPLSTSHAGTYTCRATLTSGGMETDIMIVTVQGKCRIDQY